MSYSNARLALIGALSCLLAAPLLRAADVPDTAGAASSSDNDATAGTEDVMLPTVVVTAVLAWRRRNVVMAMVSAAGVALMVWTPIDLMPKHHEVTAPLWRRKR